MTYIEMMKKLHGTNKEIYYVGQRRVEITRTNEKPEENKQEERYEFERNCLSY